MAKSLTLTRSGKAGGDPAISKEVTVSGGAKKSLDEDIPDDATTQVELSLDVSQLKGFFLTVDKACTLKTNDSGTPAHTFNMPAGGVLDWADTDPRANPFGSTDVTALFVEVADGVGTVKLEGEFILDPTV